MRTESVTTLVQKASELLTDVECSNEPILITQDGFPVAYLLDVESYELMQRRLAILEGIARGETALAEGRVASHEHAKLRMSPREE